MSNAIFLKFEGLDGECTDSAHPAWIQIHSMTHGLTSHVDRGASTATGSHGAGVTEHGDFIFSKDMDKSSLPMMAQCCAGESFGKVEVDVMVASTGSAAAPNQRLFGVVMEDVLISDIRYDDEMGSVGRPKESISLNYKKITWTYSPYDNKGKPLGDITKYWDLRESIGG